MSNKAIGVYSKAMADQTPPVTSKSTSIPAPKVTSKRTQARDRSRAPVREKSRGKSRNLPSRDEIQEFSFRLRDELKVKVQAEVPHTWQKELDDVARQLDVRKLELYRYILGEFLGKVSRRKAN